MHDETERKLMLEKNPRFIIVLDQGSRGGPPVVDDSATKSLIIDHHLSDDFPEGAAVGLCLMFQDRVSRNFRSFLHAIIRL